MTIRGCIVSRSNEISSVVVMIAGYSLRPQVRASIPLRDIGAARLPAMPANKSFSANGLYELEEEGSASIWPLAGTLVPISDTARERKVCFEKRSPLIWRGFFPLDASSL